MVRFCAEASTVAKAYWLVSEHQRFPGFKNDVVLVGQRSPHGLFEVCTRQVFGSESYLAANEENFNAASVFSAKMYGIQAYEK